MTIHSKMDLEQLKMRMGYEIFTESEAENMRSLLVNNTSYLDTSDVPDDLWYSFLNECLEKTEN